MRSVFGEMSLTGSASGVGASSFPDINHPSTAIPAINQPTLFALPIFFPWENCRTHIGKVESGRVATSLACKSVTCQGRTITSRPGSTGLAGSGGSAPSRTRDKLAGVDRRFRAGGQRPFLGSSQRYKCLWKTSELYNNISILENGTWNSILSGSTRKNPNIATLHAGAVKIVADQADPVIVLAVRLPMSGYRLLPADGRAHQADVRAWGPGFSGAASASFCAAMFK